MAAVRLRPSGAVRAVFAARLVAHGPAVSCAGGAFGPGAPARWTVTAGRQVGSAVDRNRAKRRLRHAIVRRASRGLGRVAVAKPARWTRRSMSWWGRCARRGSDCKRW